jgi:hypothetical protein
MTRRPATSHGHSNLTGTTPAPAVRNRVYNSGPAAIESIVNATGRNSRLSGDGHEAHYERSIRPYFGGPANAPFNVTAPLTVFGSTVISLSLAATSSGTSV